MDMKKKLVRDMLRHNIMPLFEKDSTVFLGDIEISESYYPKLIDYAKEVVQREKRKGFPNYINDPIFSVALIQIGAKHYHDATYWPAVMEELEMNLDPSLEQAWIRNSFLKTLKQYGKTIFDENGSIQNITSHGFVSDPNADKFFDFLWRYYEKALLRNLDNNDEALFGHLLKVIKTNNGREGTQLVMSQTQYAVQKAEQAASEKIQNILQWMDEAFHDDLYSNPKSRLHRLLNDWMQKQSGTFQEALSRTGNRSRTVVNSLRRLTSPHFLYQNGKFFLKIPAQILPPCDENDLDWVISFSCDPQEHRTKTPLNAESFGDMTDELELPLTTIAQLFSEISISLQSHQDRKQIFATFSLPAFPVRFFDQNGLSKKPELLRPGEYTGLSLPEVNLISEALTAPAEDHCEYRLFSFHFEKGDIVYIDQNFSYIVGSETEFGISRHGLCSGVKVLSGGKELPIYTEFPTLRWKAAPRQLPGTKISLNGKSVGRLDQLGLNSFDLHDGKEEMGYEARLPFWDRDAPQYCHIVLDIADGLKYSYTFYYLPGFSFAFQNIPYVFADRGQVRFAEPYRARLPEAAVTAVLDFPISAHTENLRVMLQGGGLGQELLLSLRIPLFRYQFDENDWRSTPPEPLTKKNFPWLIRFDFPDETLRIYLTENENSPTIDNPTRELHQNADGVFEYDTSRLRNWFSSNKREVFIYLKTPSMMLPMRFFTLHLKSCVLSHDFEADLERGRITGRIGVAGDGEYFVRLKGFTENHRLSADGSFEIPIQLKNHVYEIELWEKQETDGFVLENNEPILVDTMPFKVINPNDISGKSIRISFIRSCDGTKEYRPDKARFSVKNLEREKESGNVYTGKTFGFSPDGEARVIFPELKMNSADDAVRARIMVRNKEIGEYKNLWWEAKKKRPCLELPKYAEKQISRQKLNPYLPKTFIELDEYDFFVNLEEY